MARTNAISISDGFIPSRVDTPLDERSRVDSVAEVKDIPNPYIGLVFYVKDEDAYYSVKSLKAKMVGGVLKANAQIDEYEPFGGGGGTKGIIVVETLDNTDSIDIGQLFAHYTPNTLFTEASITELGVAQGDSDGFIVDKKDAVLAKGFSIINLSLVDWHEDFGDMAIDTMVEVVFSADDFRYTFKFGYDSSRLYIDSGLGNLDTWTLYTGLAEGIHAYFVSYTRKRREYKYDGSYDVTTIEKAVTADNYESGKQDMANYLDHIIAFNGGSAYTLDYYSRTIDGIEKFGIPQYAGMPFKDVSRVIDITDYEYYMQPNVYYRFGNVPQLYLSFNSPEDSSVVNQYLCEFTADEYGCALSLPEGIIWANGEMPTIEGGKTYQLSVVNNLAIITGFR